MQKSASDTTNPLLFWTKLLGVPNPATLKVPSKKQQESEKQSILLVGGPDSGKTNYLARLWEGIRGGSGIIIPDGLPTNIRYVEEALAHLLRGHFAPRSEPSSEGGPGEVIIPAKFNEKVLLSKFEIVIPDILGEVWKVAVDTFEIPTNWMDQMRHSSSAIIFTRVLSDNIVAPLDWVNARDLISMHPQLGEQPRDIPTQVALSELLRFLEQNLGKDVNVKKPRVALIVTAWDMLDEERRKSGLRKYLQDEYPLFFGHILDCTELDLEIFGASVFGGNPATNVEVQNNIFDNGLSNAGYVVCDGSEEEECRDVTLPVAWALASGS